MKQYLAMFLGSRDVMDEWMQRPDRPELEKQGMEAWTKWSQDHAAHVVSGSPLGKTIRVDKSGLSEVRNDMGAWTVVNAESQEEAAKMFEGHPHFMIFPGDRIEVMECLPIPSM